MSNSFNMSDWRRKYILMAENDNQIPKYDPAKHKTLMRGAIDYELQGDNIVAYLPFEEEDPLAVEYVFPKKQLEDYLKLGPDEEIMDNEDLEKLDSDQVYRFFHNKYSGAFGSYWNTPRGQAMRAGKTEKDPFLKPMKETRGIYFVKVSLRDALKAQEIVSDMYRNAGIMVKGEEFLAADPETIQDLIMDFGTHGIEIEDDNLDFSDYDGHSSNDMLDLYERFLNKK
jgi:hypothetical protein